MRRWQYRKSRRLILAIVALICLCGFLWQIAQQHPKEQVDQSELTRVLSSCDGRGFILGNLVSESAGCYVRGRPGHKVLHFVLEADTLAGMVQLWHTEQFLYEAGMRVAMGYEIVDFDSLMVTFKWGKDTIYYNKRPILPRHSREYELLLAKAPSYWFNSLSNATQLFEHLSISNDQGGFQALAVFDTLRHNLKKGVWPDRVYDSRGFFLYLYCCLINLGIHPENFKTTHGYFRFAHPDGATLWDSTIYFQEPAEKERWYL